MHTPLLTVEDLLAENRRLREQHGKEIAKQAQCLRDDFAKTALPAILDIETTATRELGRTSYNMKAIAWEAYNAADAMMAERAARIAGGK